MLFMHVPRQKAVGNKIGDKSTDNVSALYDKARREEGAEERRQ